MYYKWFYKAQQNNMWRLQKLIEINIQNTMLLMSNNNINLLVYDRMLINHRTQQTRVLSHCTSCVLFMQYY